MIVRNKCRRCRRGATAVEFAVIAPLLFLILCGIFITALDVFRYQQVSSLARDCARYAATHGASWAAANNGGTLTTQADIFTKVLQPHAFLFDIAKLKANSSVTWDDPTQKPITAAGMRNLVHVTVQYPLPGEKLPLVGSFLHDVTVKGTAAHELSF